MFLIFGFKGRVVVVGQGTFYCGRCGGDRRYTLAGIRRWFTFFFIPLFPISAIQGQRVHCDSCGGVYNPSALTIPTSKVMADLVSGAFRRCAVAVLKAGDPDSTLARACTVDAVTEFYQGTYRYDDDVLAQDLNEAEVDQIPLYVAPVVDRVGTKGAELFVTQCALIALADGHMSEGESEALRFLGDSFNLSRAHMVGIINTASPVRELALELQVNDDEPGE